ncbi:MAG TPA: hydrogenase maturation protease [Candidatus Sulfotelmatobacter sp.]|nr:hydrogenase maturation protease [Candidatus Sulfotelmatobacter sp.]
MNSGDYVLVLGVGNVLMGDEGVGVEVVRQISQGSLPENVQCLDGGTGSFLLLEPMQRACRVILIDATIDGNPPGTVTRLTPRFSSDYPKTLTAHDIGLKDLLDAAYLTGAPLDVTLFAISIDPPGAVGMDLSPAIAASIPGITREVAHEAASLYGEEESRKGYPEIVRG